jgi:hypothetical protein
MEPQRKGEDEVSCALRLLGRVLRDYPRAFDLIVADGLYLKAPFFHLLLDHGKDLIVVLKDERRDLLQDAQGIFRLAEPVVLVDGNVERRMWDIEGFDSWRPVSMKSGPSRFPLKKNPPPRSFFE